MIKLSFGKGENVCSTVPMLCSSFIPLNSACQSVINIFSYVEILAVCEISESLSQLARYLLQLLNILKYFLCLNFNFFEVTDFQIHLLQEKELDLSLWRPSNSGYSVIQITF